MPPRRALQPAARLLVAAAALLVAFTIAFLLPHLAPGDPISLVIDPGGGLTEAQVTAIRADLGLDRPLAAQLVDFWAGVVTGDLGTSIRFRQPVTTVLADRLPWTLLLVGGGTLGSVAVGALAGAAAAWRAARRARRDTGLVVAVLAVEAMPAFWIGLLLIGVAAVELGWLPSFGATDPTASGVAWVVGVARRLVLPATTLVLSGVGTAFLLTRATLVRELTSPYVRLAAAKGLPPRRVARHVVRNAVLPLYADTAVQLGTLLAGAVVVETVFAYPGVGLALYEGVLARDYPLLRGAFLLLVTAVVAADTVADLTSRLVDPRLGEGGT